MGWLALIVLIAAAVMRYLAIALWSSYDRLRTRPRDVFADAAHPETPRQSQTVLVVGEGSYHASLERVAGSRTIDGAAVPNDTALLVREPVNPNDSNAVQIRIGRAVVGYLTRADAVALQRSAGGIGIRMLR